MGQMTDQANVVQEMSLLDKWLKGEGVPEKWTFTKGGKPAPKPPTPIGKFVQSHVLHIESPAPTQQINPPIVFAQSPERAIALKLWNVDHTFFLARAIADFYLLYSLWLDGQDEGLFNKHTDWLYGQVTAYTDMVVGGEMRHGAARAQVLKVAAPPLSKALQTGGLPPNRASAWRAWWKFRSRYGTTALRWAETAFKAFGGGGYGGPKWAHIAEVLRLHEEGKLGVVSFMDTAFGLQHNGGIYFNKVWNCIYVQEVLDANLKADTQGVLHVASWDVQGLFKSKGGTL